MAHLRKLAPAFSLSLLTIALSGCLSSSSDSDDPVRPDLSLGVLSSALDQVTGDDVLVTIEGDLDVIDAEMDNLELWLNDTEIEPTRLVERTVGWKC
ncbi:hypothetical protein UMZ34_00205 [Halopseudomonas pachastrellae]|nr:hypothetical protein UMZ34_00205 [Halopseudomonas pachastrellae]